MVTLGVLLMIGAIVVAYLRVPDMGRWDVSPAVFVLGLASVLLIIVSS
jgi:hypothetical protein